ncbi:MAG: NADH-quinone oxidoreductase subunit N [Acidimicrobiaceae bacterium]|nr:NADH-quinone oxidoreductase subunit N [Acidimicrobiaceae bacterium]MYD07173.1 NADH-quinone oxidoreductase subunit N [Acidimicrobiaceae bacterium]MYI59445.1 NADH-quinone oxidoreductase subunit N [Acidimicrobiaceae bacterium]
MPAQLAQISQPVTPPQYSLAGLSPLIILAVGAFLLIMFRSVIKRLPATAERFATIAVGPTTVVAAWIVGGLVGDEMPLANVRADIGTLWFAVLFALVLVVAALFVGTMRVGFDAIFTSGTGLVALAAIAELWNDHHRVTWPAEFGERPVGLLGNPVRAIGDQFSFDGFSLVMAGVILSAVVLCALLLDEYLRRERIDGPEMYVLMMLSAAGGVVMAGAGDLIVLFLGLETLSISVYIMAALHVRRSESLEAGLKYFVLGAFSSAFLLYGMALVYGATGSLNLHEIRLYLASVVILKDAMLLAGLAMMLVGLGFKVAAVPFHTWTPDVYQGAPTPVVAFMASAVKAAGFAALVRVFVVTFLPYWPDWTPAVAVLAMLTLLVGAVLAIVQRDVKRMLAYSSISHAGFILVGVEAASARGTAAVVFYVAAYAFMVIGTFGVLTVVSGPGDRKTNLDDLDGLAARRPALALALTIFLLAQAGVPLTTGFVAKFEIIGAAVEVRSFWLAVVAMVSAVVSAFLYLRIVLSVYLGSPADDSESSDDAPVERVHPAAGLAIGIALAVTIGFGLIPGPIDELATEAIPQLFAAGQR